MNSTMHKCPTCGRVIGNPYVAGAYQAASTPEAHAMNMLNRDRLDDLRRNTVPAAPAPSPLCHECWSKTTEASEPANAPATPATPDYTKVGGWLMFFGILAGLSFPLGVISMVSAYAQQAEIFRRLPAWAGFIYAGSAMIGCLLLIVALTQCVCIFQRRRLGRTLSLAYFGTSLGLLLIKLPALGELIKATANGAGFANSDAFSGGFIFSWFVGVALNSLCLAYFLKSERVAKTLVN